MGLQEGGRFCIFLWKVETGSRPSSYLTNGLKGTERCLRITGFAGSTAPTKGVLLERSRRTRPSHVTGSGVRSWIYRSSQPGRHPLQAHDSEVPYLSLKAAREERDKLAGQVARGVSPAHEQKKQRREAQRERAEGCGSDPTFVHSRTGIAPKRVGIIAAIQSRSAAPSTIRFFLPSVTSC